MLFLARGFPRVGELFWAGMLGPRFQRLHGKTRVAAHATTQLLKVMGSGALPLLCHLRCIGWVFLPAAGKLPKLSTSKNDRSQKLTDSETGTWLSDFPFKRPCQKVNWDTSVCLLHSRTPSRQVCASQPVSTTQSA